MCFVSYTSDMICQLLGLSWVWKCLKLVLRELGSVGLFLIYILLILHVYCGVSLYIILVVLRFLYNWLELNFFYVLGYVLLFLVIFLWVLWGWFCWLSLRTISFSTISVWVFLLFGFTEASSHWFFSFMIDVWGSF